ncbi:MAG: hypothetical protein HKP13_01955 [Gammaproteobacteria bacterium]|nr:hypothetical protein [Gammaproteobacteria bacterium]
MATILRTSKITPYPMFMALGAVLDGERALEIREIEWSVSADLPPANGILMNRISPNETGKRLRSASNAPSVSLPAPRQNGINPMAPYQIALIKGQLVAFSGDYRQAIALVENFAKRLSRLDRVEHVEIVRRPLDVSSEEALAGKAGAAVLGTAGFTVRIVLRNEV